MPFTKLREYVDWSESVVKLLEGMEEVKSVIPRFKTNTTAARQYRLAITLLSSTVRVANIDSEDAAAVCADLFRALHKLLVQRSDVLVSEVKLSSVVSHRLLNTGEGVYAQLEMWLCKTSGRN